MKIRSLLCLEPDHSLSKLIPKAVSVDHIQKVKVITGYIDAIDKDEKFDTILYIDVLEHMEHDALEFAKAASHLRPGSHLVTLVPEYQFLVSEFDKAIDHQGRYNRKTLPFVSDRKLEWVKLFYLDSLGSLTSLANRLFLKQHKPTLSQISFWDKVIVPMSKFSDPLLFHSFGKSLIGIWHKSSDATNH